MFVTLQSVGYERDENTGKSLVIVYNVVSYLTDIFCYVQLILRKYCAREKKSQVNFGLEDSNK